MHKYKGFVCLFDLILYVPVNNLSVMSGLVFLGHCAPNIIKVKASSGAHYASQNVSGQSYKVKLRLFGSFLV